MLESGWAVGENGVIAFCIKEPYLKEEIAIREIIFS